MARNKLFEPNGRPVRAGLAGRISRSVICMYAEHDHSLLRERAWRPSRQSLLS